jgi:hypothetical protein
LGRETEPSRLAERVASLDRVTMFSDLLRADRERDGLTGEQAARRLRVTRSVCRRSRPPSESDWETYDRIGRLFG